MSRQCKKKQMKNKRKQEGSAKGVWILYKDSKGTTLYWGLKGDSEGIRWDSGVFAGDSWDSHRKKTHATMNLGWVGIPLI